MDVMDEIAGVVADVLAPLVATVLGIDLDPATKETVGWIGTLAGAIAAILSLYLVIKALSRGGQADNQTMIEQGEATRDTVVGTGHEVKHDIAQLRAMDAENFAKLEAKLEATLEAMNSNGNAAANDADGLRQDLNAAVETLLKAGREASLSDASGHAAEQAISDLIEELSKARERIAADEADLWRQKGALAFLHDTHVAAAAYQTAANLNPDDADAWNQLGHLQMRLGEIDAAMASYGKVLDLSARTSSDEDRAVAYGNLGNVYQTRGDLGEAEKMFRKSLELHKVLGRKEGMASDYGSLGNVFQTRGDLTEAEKMYRKSLELNEALGSKEGMANQYGNLGNLYKTRGDLNQACAFWSKSRSLFRELGSPTADQVQQWMHDAGCPNVDN